MVDVQIVQEPVPGPAPRPGGPLSYLHWGPAFAGALVAAAFSFVLMSFASAIGLMVISPSPTWRDTSVWLAVLSGVWIIVVAVASFALGGDIAGRLRSSWSAHADEVEFRDGAHGLLVWAIGIVFGAGLLWMTAMTYGAINGTSSAQRDTPGAPSFLAYEIDHLFRSDKRLETVATEVRAEAGRALMKGVGREDLPGEDRAYLNRVVAGATGLAAPDAERRVNQVIAQARQSASQARRSAVVLGFATAAALAAAAAAAWAAAGIGGRHRDNEFAPPMRFGRTVTRPI